MGEGRLPPPHTLDQCGERIGRVCLAVEPLQWSEGASIVPRMDPFKLAPLLVLLLFGGLFGSLLLGRRIGVQHAATGTDVRGHRSVEGSVFGLLGLLIAFTFAGASSRFENRRTLIVQEANAITTAYLRVDLLPPETQPQLRNDLRQYVDARVAVYRAMANDGPVREAMEQVDTLQREIWKEAVRACQLSPERPTGLVLPAINSMIDITTTRAVANQTHPPAVVYGMLMLLALVCAVLAGYGMTGDSRVRRTHTLAFAAVLTFTIYVILDLEFPRSGFIRIDAADQLLVDVRNNMR